jgi:hypothetical protein
MMNFDRMLDQVHHPVRIQVLNQIKNNVRSHVMKQIRDQIMYPVKNIVWSQLSEEKFDALG